MEKDAADRVMVRTGRVYLRPWCEADAESLYRYASDGRVSELALWPRHTSVDMSRQVIKDFFMSNQHTYAIVLRSSDEPIGCIGLVPESEEHFPTLRNEREVGYWIGFPFWGKGLTTEALKGLIDYCREVLRLRFLLITADIKNIASHKVAEKCGFLHIADYVAEGVSGKAFRLEL